MTSKYSLAKAAMRQLVDSAESAGIEPDDAYEALLISIIHDFKERKATQNLRSLLQYEVDNLGGTGAVDLPRGGGHS